MSENDEPVTQQREDCKTKKSWWHWSRICAPYLAADRSKRLRWFGKFGISCVVLTALFSYIGSNWKLALDGQKHKCMDATVLLVSQTAPVDLKRGEIVAFHSRGAEPIFEDGTLLAKFVMGLPGDRVEVTSDERITVNGHTVACGLMHLDGTPEKKRKFFGSRILGADEYWMLGPNERSFDSRYWGPVHKDQLVGRAYVLY